MWTLNKILTSFKNWDNKKHVIIIEDNKILSDMYKYKLELEWYKVNVAYSWYKWIELINKWIPDLVLLDIMMPEINGFEVLEILKNEWIECKVIVFTNLNNSEDMERAKSLWAIDYIVKASLTPKELITRINTYFK